MILLWLHEIYIFAGSLYFMHMLLIACGCHISALPSPGFLNFRNYRFHFGLSFFSPQIPFKKLSVRAMVVREYGPTVLEDNLKLIYAPVHIIKINKIIIYSSTFELDRGNNRHP